MSADFGGIFPTVKVTQPRRGRPRATQDVSQRRRHIGLALIYFGSNWTLARIAKMHDVGTDTARRWIRSALTYSEPEADRVRSLAENSQRKIKKPL